ncbi:MAG: hypothetical protein GY798_16385 [Hyphomicrobiales bacterium]|nr:hypothetical protein [Hyphomicrobiales bacterium]
MRILISVAFGLMTTVGAVAESSDLQAAAIGFVAEEAGDASASQQAAMVECILAGFDGLDDAEIATILAEDDFEDSLDALVMAHPETEDALEVCLG